MDYYYGPLLLILDDYGLMTSNINNVRHWTKLSLGQVWLACLIRVIKGLARLDNLYLLLKEEGAFSNERNNVAFDWNRIQLWLFLIHNLLFKQDAMFFYSSNKQKICI